MTEAYKKTALRLHSLNASDRQWLLEKLPAHQRERLVSMLDELATLGIPRQGDLVDELIMNEPPVDQAPMAVKKVPTKAVDTLLHAAPEMLHHILKDETPATIAALLFAYDWPWRQSVLDAFDSSDRQAISEAVAQMESRLAPKVSETVVNLLAEKFYQSPEYLPAVEKVEKKSSKYVARVCSFFRRLAWQR